jgi:hypothetical protein
VRYGSAAIKVSHFAVKSVLVRWAERDADDYCNRFYSKSLPGTRCRRAIGYEGQPDAPHACRRTMTAICAKGRLESTFKRPYADCTWRAIKLASVLGLRRDRSVGAGDST